MEKSSLAITRSEDSAIEDTDRPVRRGRMGPPATTHAGRRKANTKHLTNGQEDITKTAKNYIRENEENSAEPARGGLKIRLSSKLLDFDTEVERRHKEIEAEGQLASRALTEVLTIWKMQLPPLIKKMPLLQLNNEFKGDISAALQRAATIKLAPLMTSLTPRSVKRPTRALSSTATPKSASTVAAASSSSPLPSISSAMDVDLESTSIDTSKLDIFSSAIISQFTGTKPMSDGDKLSVLAKLKHDITLIEKSLTVASKRQ